VGSIEDALDVGRRLGASGLRPGTGATGALFETLASLGAVDLGVARAIEPHLDALAILDQAQHPELATEDSCWGVFAAEGGPPLRASIRDGGWMLDGTKLWCSLASHLTNALVTATRDDGDRQLFAVNLKQPGVRAETEGWFARGLAEIASGPVEFSGVSATPVGDPGWYLNRPGFSWGGIAVAACWYGGAVGIARTVFESVRARSEPGDILLAHLGSIDEALNSARRALAEGARDIDAGSATGDDGKLLAKRVRATVARAVELTITTSWHALGPAPLAQDAAHAKRVADLELYIRQHHAERDDASLGAQLARSAELPW
jgi:alkylation response protein AidB-like acyl-CoA dehydrogenase